MWLALEVVFLLSAIITTTFCWILCLTIISYFKSKPLGQETLLDKFIIDFTASYILKATASNCLSHFVIFPYEIPELLARAAFYINNFIVDNSYMWSIALFIVKYLSIFHPYLLEFQRTDSEIVKRARLCVTLSALVPFLIEHIVIKDLDGYSTYLMLAQKPIDPGLKNKAGIPITTSIMTYAAVALLCYLYYRIEKDRISHEESLPLKEKILSFFKNEDQPHHDFKKNTSRVLITAGVALLAYTLVVQYQVIEALNVKKVIVAISFIVAPIMPPLLYIINHKRMVVYVKRLIKIG